MLSKNTKLFSLILIIADFFVLLAAFTVAYVLRVQLDHRPLVNEVFAFDYLTIALSIIPFWILIFAALGLYSSTTYNRRLAEWGKILIGSFIGILFVIGWEYFTRQSFFPARLVVGYAFISAFALILLEREFFRMVRSIAYRFGRGISRVLIVGNSSATKDIAEALSSTHRSGFKIVALAGPKRYIPPGIDIKHFSSVEDALRQIRSLRISTIIQTDLYDSEERNQRILSAAQVNHIRYSFIPGEAGFYTGQNTVDVFLGYPIITVSQTPLVGWGAIVKRIFDLLLIIIASPIWLPIFLLIMLAQKLFNPGPVFYNSRRLGLHSEVIDTYKFRSMKPQYSGADAAKIFRDMGRHDLAREYEKTRKIRNDPRITWFGAVLRKTSLDELPQIVNVLRGDMSLVGPRPILKEEKHFYKDRAQLLFSVKPGITGLWQVSGRSEMSFEQRVDLELYYAQNWSFWLDVKIMLKTISVVLFGKGAQ